MLKNDENEICVKRYGDRDKDYRRNMVEAKNDLQYLKYFTNPSSEVVTQFIAGAV